MVREHAEAADKPGQSGQAKSSLVFICSTGGDSDAGVYSYEFDHASGTLAPLSSLPMTRPMYLAVHPDGDHLFVVDRNDTGEVVSLEIDRSDGTLTPLSRQSSAGPGPCYVSADASGQFVFAANYDAGTVAMLPVDEEGYLGPPSDVVDHGRLDAGGNRQPEPHPHAIVPGPRNRFVYVPDLGLDRVVAYRIDAEVGRLVPAPDLDVELPAGSGPRHLEFGSEGDDAFLVNELNSTLTRLSVDRRSGELTISETVSALPTERSAAENPPADVHVHPTGRWVFVSIRGHESIATFAVADDGLALVGHESTRGQKPRDFAVDPTGRWLLAENRDSHRVVPFAIDADAGGLSPTADETAIGKPTCAVFVVRERR
ncbi:lactonase family protein [Haloarchaeobius sp. TZWSO28]|uniref:lactonase family protein n=1 Tax=Haloarchaeobius sp. TZWSO28 TaxID=3446119 RepID=UPI003EBBE5BD